MDPTQVGNFRESVITDIQDGVSFEDKPSGIPSAVDPTPDDLIATVENYRVGPGDVFQITLLDFMARGAQSEFILTVDDLGYVDIAQLGRVRVEGLSLPEIRDEVVRQAKAKGIYAEESEPTITVMMGDQQNRTFNISGVIQTPGMYRIPRADFRLREALNMAGGLGELIQVIYVIRDEPRQRRVMEESGDPPVSPEPAGQDGLESMSSLENTITTPAPTYQTGEEPQTVTPSRPVGPALPSEEPNQDLIDALTPPEAASPSDQPVPPAASPSTAEAAPPLRPFIFVNDKLIQAPPIQDNTGTQALTPATAQAVPQDRQSTRPVDWSELVGEERQRIIRISADALRNGDGNANIVIRHQDWIRVDPGPVGSYYMGGHVVMPGQYPINGEQVTLTQAVITARGLDPLAWPTRCEIRRRIDRDREQITQWDLARVMGGQDPDVFLRPNDVVNVGTHAIAPFLYTIRNAFRFNYGFSFSYDRNWAEYDTLSGQYYRARTEASRRGLLSAFTD